jgi:hypothetical protein
MATTKWNKINPHYLGRLMFNYLCGTLTPGQEKTLTAWRNLSANNEKSFQESIDPGNIRRDLKAIYESRIRILNKRKQNIPPSWT